MATQLSANKDLLLSRNDIGEAVSKALGLYVGRRCRYTVRELHEATGVPTRMIESAKCSPDGRQAEDWRPLKTEEIFSIAKFLGEGFTTELLQMCGQAAYDLPQVEPPHPAVIVRDCAQDTAEVAGMAAEEAEFTAQDERKLRAIGHRLVDRGMALVAIAFGKRRRRVAA